MGFRKFIKKSFDSIGIDTRQDLEKLENLFKKIDKYGK